MVTISRKSLSSKGAATSAPLNVLRTTGRVAGIVTLLLDIAKGWFAVWIAGRLTDHDLLWMSVAALAVMLGHAYPVFLKFKGGKAVASLMGAFLCLTPAALALEIIVFVVIVVWTRHISLGSIVAAATSPLAVWLVYQQAIPTIAAAIAGAFIVYRHSSNIQRLRAGTRAALTCEESSRLCARSEAGAPRWRSHWRRVSSISSFGFTEPISLLGCSRHACSMTFTFPVFRSHPISRPLPIWPTRWMACRHGPQRRALASDSVVVPADASAPELGDAVRERHQRSGKRFSATNVGSDRSGC